MDPDLNLLRCRTRNEASLLPYSTVFPILLPSLVKNEKQEWEMCPFTELLIRKIHVNSGHQGVPHVLSILRNEFWVLQGRRTVQKILHKCVICKKVQGNFYSEPPSPALPEFRVVKSRPFRGTGLDYLGHFWVKDEKGPKYKVWFIQFTCGSTRAVHLEAVKSKNVEDFLNAISRFMNTRGIPVSFISDHEKSFVRVSQELESISKSKRVQNFFQEKRISWNFYTEKSPNKGGFIERLNASIKRIFYKVLGKNTLNFDQFRTLAVYAASVINDRPLTYLYSDIDSEFKALSPSMLMHGHNLHEPPHLNLHKPQDEEEMKVSERYFFMEKIRNSFWNLWKNQYLQDLFERHVRQKSAQKELVVPKIGDVVLINEDNTPRRKWKMGKVVDIDVKRGSVRKCTVQCLSAEGNVLNKLFRSPEKLVPLEINSREDIVDVKDLIPLEGDPRVPIVGASDFASEKYSKAQLKRMKKAKIWPPYRPSKEFKDPKSINVGPDTDFVSGQRLWKNGDEKNGRKVHFDFPEE